MTYTYKFCSHDEALTLAFIGGCKLQDGNWFVLGKDYPDGFTDIPTGYWTSPSGIDPEEKKTFQQFLIDNNIRFIRSMVTPRWFSRPMFVVWYTPEQEFLINCKFPKWNHTSYPQNAN